jgi:hypothetical protein
MLRMDTMTVCSELYIQHINTGEPGYNDVGLWDTSPIASDILWSQLIRHC